MHVCFVHILLPWFLMDGLVNIILLEVGHLYIHFGDLNYRVRDYCWHLWDG